MAIFYTDSGSFNNLEVTGSTILSGSLIVSGATNFGPSGLTGSLFGTSSFTDSSSVAVSSSFASTASFLNPVVALSASNGLTMNLGGTNPVLIKPYQSFASEYGVEVPLLKVSQGRFDFGILDGKSEMRVEGGTSRYGIYNITSTRFYFLGWEDSRVYFGADSATTIQNSLLYVRNRNSAWNIATFTDNNDNVQATISNIGHISASVFSGSLFGTGSWASNAVSAQNGFPFSGSAVITGSLLISSSGATDGLQVSGSTRAIGKIDVVSPANTASSMSISVGDVAGYASFKVSSDIVYYEFPSTQVVFNLGFISTTDVSVRGAIKDDNNLALRITGGTANITHLSSSLIVTGSQAITASNVQLNNLTDTTATNKVLVLDTVTNKIFTTASVGSGGPGGSAFPFNGAAVITGSLLISGSGTTPALRVSGSTQFLGSGSTVFAISGSLGPLFEVTDSISGELFTLTSASIDIFKVDNQQNVLVSGSLKVNNTLHVTGSTILSSSGTSLQVTGSSNFRDNLTVNGGTLFVDTANNRTNMSGSIAVTGSMTMLSSSLVINTGSITINTGSLTVDQLPGQTSGITLRVTGSNQVLYIGNDGQGSSFLKTNNTQLRFGGLGSTGFAWDGLSLYPEATDEEGLGSTSNRWQRLVVNQVTASIVSASLGITGSLAQFNPSTLKLTVGTTAPSSPAVNDLWVDTN